MSNSRSKSRCNRRLFENAKLSNFAQLMAKNLFRACFEISVDAVSQTDAGGGMRNSDRKVERATHRVCNARQDDVLIFLGGVGENRIILLPTGRVYL